VLRSAVAGLVLLAGFSSSAFASESAHLDGAQLGLIWGIPFAGILLSIAILPMFASRFWEHHFGKVAAFWSLAFLVPCTLQFGLRVTTGEMVHTLVLEYLPFIILLFSLFVVAGGIRIVGNLIGNPETNLAILAIGTVLASFIGTTGASMLLIRPLIRANENRRHRAHIFVFFIFLVANIGGSLTPLGDPPLFLGFLRGVDFLWTTTAMFLPMAMASIILLGLFYLIDRSQWRREPNRQASTTPRQVRIDGAHNFAYLLGIVMAVLLSGVWQTGIEIPLGFGATFPPEGLARDIVLLLISYLSLRTTRKATRIENAFSWTPIQEVAFLFAGIFAAIIPVLSILHAGRDGAFAPLLDVVSRPDGTPIDAAYFWLTGVLSSFLDNAPTYLVFFNLAGGDAQALMGQMYTTLLAISAGAVFMGANTYIGNGPNFMVKAICEERGVRMPSFFGYMMWSGLILLPIFGLITMIFFR
jgi:Na+/H+ antiporter NhaD/arsenite permease-like protein